jgi:hypothetical protein
LEKSNGSTQEGCDYWYVECKDYPRQTVLYSISAHHCLDTTSGAGPSGLAAAKSLIHDHPPTVFAPVVYERQSHVGGIWPVRSDDQTNIVPPDMPTNASKHLVHFSDLAWDSVFPQVETFPRAHEVGKYLESYAGRYLPPGAIRLGREVESVSRTPGRSPEWQVVSRDVSEGTTDKTPTTDAFDVIVASGFFASAHRAQLPGLDSFEGVIIHSSELRQVEDLLSKAKDGQKIVVIGGSMSGGEAAATLAFSLSSLQNQSRPDQDSSTARRLSVYHITPRPFWSVPPFVPVDAMAANGAFNPQPTFLPLDLVLADLHRHPEGPIRFSPSSTFGPDAARYFNQVLRSFVGSDQSELGDGALMVPESRLERPPWLIISSTHAEFLRSHDIHGVVGRATSVRGSTLTVQDSDGQVSELSNVGMIVMATGFSPHPALSFLSAPVREALGYEPDNEYDPIRLYNYGTTHPSIPTLGFVGFYRGPYFGVLQQQARFLSALWSDSLGQVPTEGPAHVDTIEQRGQFPMGDYVGLMESFASVLGTERLGLSCNDSSRRGPAVPARYGNHSIETEARDQAAQSCETVRKAIDDQSLFTGPAVFRALQGKWKVRRDIQSAEHTHPSGIFTGEASMYPRMPTADGYAAEFLYVEEGELLTTQGLRLKGGRSYVYRLSAFERQKISAWFVKTESGSKEADYLFHDLAFIVDDDNHADDHGESRIEDERSWGSGWRARGSHHLCEQDHYDSEYWFRFQGISLQEWGIGYRVSGPSKDYRTRASYTR